MALSWCLLGADSVIAQTRARCSDDLMKSYRIHIPYAQLLKSEKPIGSSQILCASVYKIPGKHAHIAETLLTKKYGMEKLVFQCCGWFPRNGRDGTFRHSHSMANGAYAAYSISMYSEETLEREWEKIESFYIQMTVFSI